MKALAPAPPKEASPDAAKPASGKAKKAGAIVNDQAAAAQLQANVQAASQWLERASTAGQLLDFVQKLPAFASTAKNLPPAYLDAAKEVGNLATSLADLYKNFKITLPKSPESIPLQTHLELLQAEEDHFSNLGMIAARRDREAGDELSLIEEAQNQLNAIAKLRMPDDIADSLRKGVDAYTKAKPADKKQRSDELFTLVHCLYNTAAIASRDDTPLRLATLRLVAEEREYSIREAAIGARSYEQAIVNGVERLALYHKGGVKPQTLTQFISALATLGLIPAVLTR